jgi:dihydroorotate dehydrogenase
VTRPNVRSRHRAQETGGLSGRPLLPRVLRSVEQWQARDLVIIGTGGIMSGADARAVRDAGADLVQLWTGMIYAGPGLIGETITATG